ncbi:MAG TPA: hypothetical protein DCE23_01430 [Firmicutes bacterium]|nr:hypothetical protein [Bacillota bacterium]
MKPTMYDNFNLLEKRVIDTLTKSDLERIKEVLQRIKSPTICTGVGGSNVVSNFASKVISRKNTCIVESIEPRSILYKDLTNYDNILACSYSGRNYGVSTSFNNDKVKYLLSSIPKEGVNNITYASSIQKEDSFISLAATLMPMSILLAYYTDNDLSVIREILSTKKDYLVNISKIYEVLSGYDTSTASLFLESTLVESGIAIPIIHDKYGYCHGRSTTSYHQDSSAVIFNKGTELDKYLMSLLSSYYNQVISIDSKYKDPIIDDFYFTYQSMLLAKSIASTANKDLSRVEYSPLVKKLYHYKGEM